jgi:hypothetical protein
MTTQSRGIYNTLFLLVASALLATGCGHNLAIIHYSQPANAFVFDSDPTGTPHTTTSAGDGLFAFYCINKIENTDTNAAPFTFAASKVFALNDPANRPGNASFSNQVQTAPATKTVPAHTTSQPLGRIVIAVPGVADPKALKVMLNLNYNSSGSDSVLMVRDGGSSPPPVKFLDPASPVHPNNLPSCP